MTLQSKKSKIYIVFALIAMMFSLTSFFGLFFVCEYKEPFEFEKYGEQVDGIIKDYYFRDGSREYVLVYEYKTAQATYNCVKAFLNDRPKAEREQWCINQLGNTEKLVIYKKSCMRFADLQDKNYLTAFYCACAALATGAAGAAVFGALTVKSAIFGSSGSKNKR